MANEYNSFKALLDSGYEFERAVERVVHNDENTANNRLFVWNFEEEDLEEFLGYFEIYKNSQANVSSRQTLNGNLMRKMNGMIRENYNPVECMLYASKIINNKLENDNELQEILAERIEDVYLKQEAETVSVIKNIIRMWTWVPQNRAVITAVGIIGDNKELFDDIMMYYSEDPVYKPKVFYALMRNKSIDNLERAMKIIMNLQDTEEDNKIGRAFVKEIVGFGYDGSKIVRKYYDNPGVSRIGSKILKKIRLKTEEDTENIQDDSLFSSTLANKSVKDDLAYKDFLNYCYEKYDNHAFYLCRFSRRDIGSFLKEALESGKLDGDNKDTAIISLGIIGAKGYPHASSTLAACEQNDSNGYAVVVANILLGNEKYADKLAGILCSRTDHELGRLYRILRNSNITNCKEQLGLVHQKLEKCFRDLLETEDYASLECLASNFQMLWDKKLYGILSKNILLQINDVLFIYSENRIPVPQNIIISLIETIVHSWNPDVEKALFALYKNSENRRVQETSLRKLKERKTDAPR